MTRMFFVAYQILNKFAHVQNFDRTNSFRNNVLRKCDRATRQATKRGKCHRALEAACC
jgi:hypothetical protein